MGRGLIVGRHRIEQFILEVMNPVQRTSLAAFICLIVLAVFLHNPLSGYTIELEQHPVGPRPCNEAERRELRDNYIWAEKNLKPSGYTPEQIEQKARECTSLDYPTQYLPFEFWHSNWPHIFWLGNVANLLFTLLCLAVMAGSVTVVFRTRATKSPPPNDA